MTTGRVPRRLADWIGWYRRHRGVRAIVVLWLLTRVAMLALLVGAEQDVRGDVFYYWRELHALPHGGLAATLTEYPTPVAWALSLPYATAFGFRQGYLVVFVVLMMALDAAFTYWLWRSGRQHDLSVDFWVVFVFLLGPLAYLRFDMLPTVLVGGSLLVARRRRWLAGALLGVGAAVKLWPALLLPAFLARRGSRHAIGLSFCLTAGGLAIVSLLVSGWGRLVSPLEWQSHRGLQIESIWASPLMIARALHPGSWQVHRSRYNAFEIFGAGVSPSLALATLAGVVGLAAVVVLLVRAFRDPNPSASGLAMVVLATVAIVIVTNKTLSPQYLLWLAGPMAALLVLRPELDARARAATNRLAWALLGLALFTHVIFPTAYDGLHHLHPAWLRGVATGALSIRNLALLAFTAFVYRLAWSSLAPLRVRVSRSPSPGDPTPGLPEPAER